MIVKLSMSFIMVLICFMSGCDGSQNNLEQSEEVALPYELLLNKDDINRLEQLSKQGDGEASRKLSNYYSLVKNDYEKAFYWNEIAARNGHVIAQKEVGKIYLAGAKPLRKRDLELARYWLKKASDGGDKQAQHYLELIMDKNDLNMSVEKALKGNAEAAFKLSQYYIYVDVNYDKWEKWLEVSAKNGHPEAQFLFGVRLINTDKNLAKYWLEKAANQGHTSAKKTLQEQKWR